MPASSTLPPAPYPLPADTPPLDSRYGHHWLTWSYEGPPAQAVDVMGKCFEPAPSPTKHYFRQPNEWHHESGATLHHGRGDRCVVDMPGEVCETWSAEGLGWLSALNGRPTRHDVACDLEPAGQSLARLLELRHLYEIGQFTGFTRSQQWMVNPEGVTFYLGSRSADRRLRVYNRRGPLRLEVQYRPVARSAPAYAGQISANDAASIWRSHAKQMLFITPWFLQLCTGHSVDLTAASKPTTTLANAVGALTLQYGATIWAILAAGVPAADLAPEPKALRFKQRRKFDQFVADAEEIGLDPSTLKQALARLKTHN